MKHWNGYTVDEKYMIGMEKPHVRELCYGVQRCIHGKHCKKCCHEFTRMDLMEGRLINTAPHDGSLWVLRLPLRNFFWEIQYGPLQIRPYHEKLFRKCKNNFCCNLHHIYKGRMANETGFWQAVSVCAHGKDCKECCWKWLGRREPYFSAGHLEVGVCGVTFPKTKKLIEMFTHRLVFYHLYKKMPSKDIFAYHMCTQDLCCNPAHIRFIPKSTVISESSTKHFQEKRLQKRLYAVAQSQVA